MMKKAKTYAKLKGAAINTAFALSCIFLLWLFCLVFVYASFTIPSESMEPTLRPGDVVVVEKVSTGARLFDIIAAAQGEKADVRRMPGWRKFSRGDVLVFNFVHRKSWDTIAMNVRTYYIKRCIAEAGDTVEISRFKYIVNGDTLPCAAAPEAIGLRYPDDSIARAERRRGYMADLSDSIDNWTVRDYGPLVVPAKGMTLPVDTVTFRRYRQIIERETGLALERRQGRVWLGDDTIQSYTFSDNYYFMAGDNVTESMDSRYWGLVPEDFIVGRAVMVVWSKNRGGVQWDRILKLIE